MPGTRKTIRRDKIAEAKLLYERTRVPVEDIAALLGISGTTLDVRAREWGWKRRKTGAIEVSRVRRRKDGRNVVVREIRPRGGGHDIPQAPAERLALAEKIVAVAEREIAAIEQLFEVLGASDQTETESAARTFASIARTLRELAQLDAPLPDAGPTDERPATRSLDELRASISRKLEALIAGATGSGGASPPGGA